MTDYVTNPDWRCQKCGEGGCISGPVYEPAVSSFRESLRYRCTVCGYSFTKPCADAKPNVLEQFQEMLGREARRG